MPVLAWTIGAPELLLILALVLILFGAGRLPQVFSQLGSAMKNFRDAQREDVDSIDVGPSPSSKRISDDAADAEELSERARERERA